MTITTQRFKNILPFLVLFFLIAILWRELFYAKPNELPSALIGKSVPTFQLNNLLEPSKPFTEKDLHGRVSLLNIWATWCQACLMEHEALVNIKNKYGIAIYGINYKDNPDHVKAWLKEKGNPFVAIGDDASGDVAIDFGIFGTPETYVITSSGRIIYRHVGVLDETNFENVIYPLIKKYETIL